MYRLKWWIKELVKLILANFHMELKKLASNPFKVLEIDVLLDVGANVGQFALKTRKGGYAGQIVSFEPLKREHKALGKLSKADPLWSIYKRCAIGGSSGVEILHMSKNSYSSSLRVPLLDHIKSAPDSRIIGEETVQVTTLDAIISELGINPLEKSIFLKIDVQGHEKEVLKGVMGNLSSIKAVQIELSLIPLYSNQETYLYYFNFFLSHGFVVWNLESGFREPDSGRLLQFDVLFVNLNLYQAVLL